jgi:hypothetical protein
VAIFTDGSKKGTASVLVASRRSFWQNAKWLTSPTHHTDLAPCDFFLFSKMKLKLKERRFDTVEEILAKSQSARHRQKRTSSKRSKNVGDGGTCVYMREGTTSRVMAADRPYAEFYDFYSVSPNNLDTPSYTANWNSETNK